MSNRPRVFQTPSGVSKRQRYSLKFSYDFVVDVEKTPLSDRDLQRLDNEIQLANQPFFLVSHVQLVEGTLNLSLGVIDRRRRLQLEVYRHVLDAADEARAQA